MKKLLIALFSWRVFLFLPFFITLGILSVQDNYLGGGMKNYLATPYLWGWANFDGEHYLSIAQHGYQPLQYFFFPAYPSAISIIARLFSDSLVSFLLSGLLISHVSFAIAIIGFYKLLALDYKIKTTYTILLTLLLFPTSFYFAAVYTESFFLMLVIWGFYFARTGRWWAASFLGILASATRLIGVLLVPALLFEWIFQYKGKLNKNSSSALIWILLISIGLFGYMYYLQGATGDPLYFFHNVNVFGDQRSNKLILLPQVFYRYVVKILPYLEFRYFPVVFTSFFEFLIGILFFVLSIISFKYQRASYSVFLIGGYFIPTLAGSFSSMPRYCLVLFPGFILLGRGMQKLPKMVQLTLFLLMAATLTIAQALFVKGYWLS